MKKIIAAVCTCAALNSYSQLPAFGWAKQLPGTNGTALATDAAGNVYTLGRLSAAGNFDFDPGPGTFLLNGANGTAFISKLTSEGNFVLAIQIPVTNGTPEGIFVDAAQNIYVTGQFTLTQDFDPGPGVFNMTSFSQNDAYILKLNAAGDFQWARQLGGTEGDIGYSIAVGSNGNVYSAGTFNGTADFDPGASTFNMTAGTIGDTYISALDVNGDFIWAKQIAGGFNQAHNLVTTPTNDLLVVGQFNGTKDFDPNVGVFNMTSAGSSDIYIQKLSSAGNFLGAWAFGGIGTDVDEAITIDVLGNMYLTGNFTFTPDFDPGPATFNLTTAGSSDIFVLKLDATGGFVWVKQLAGTTAESGRDIKVDIAGNVYTTGFFMGTTDFDPGPGTFNLVSLTGNVDIYVSKLDADGNFGWAFGFGATTSEDRGHGLALDATGNVYTAGNFQGGVDFDPGPATTTLFSNVTNVFVQRLGMALVLPLTLQDFSGVASRNTSVLSWETSSEINTRSFEIEWSTDGQTFRKIASIPAAGNSSQHLYYHYTHDQPANDLNYYRLKMVDINGEFTYSSTIRIRHAITTWTAKVFPNPVHNILQLTIQAPADDVLPARLVNSEGKTVLSKSFVTVRGSNQLEWDLSSLPAGSYFIVFPGNRLQTVSIAKY
jgi:hypothetical protein